MSKQWIYLLVILGLELLLVYAYYNTFNYTSTGIGYSIVKAIAVILVIIGGILFFEEKLSVINIIGIIMIIIGIIIVSL